MRCFMSFAFFKIQIPGLGLLLRNVKTPRTIKFLDQRLYFEPSVAESYGLHIINLKHEKGNTFIFKFHRRQN